MRGPLICQSWLGSCFLTNAGKILSVVSSYCPWLGVVLSQGLFFKAFTARPKLTLECMSSTRNAGLPAVPGSTSC
jgi:hypothetical protein